MAKVDVEVIEGVVDGNRRGAILSISEDSAKRLEQVGYVKILPKPKKSQTKKEAAPKKPAKKTAKDKEK